MTISISPVDTKVTILDYGAGNVMSLINALIHVGISEVNIKIASTAEDILDARILIFPGVGAFKTAVDSLHRLGFWDALCTFLRDCIDSPVGGGDRRFLGICVGMQVLFEGSDESPHCRGLSVLSGHVRKLSVEPEISKSVPHIGWNSMYMRGMKRSDYYYFVHSYAVPMPTGGDDCAVGVAKYGRDVFLGSVCKGSILATQFHPEKSGVAGLNLLRLFLSSSPSVGGWPELSSGLSLTDIQSQVPGTDARPRIIACMDVCENEEGEIVVTKGDSYNIVDSTNGSIRAHGSPVHAAAFYYESCADEIVFLNITAYRKCTLDDQPMLRILRETCKRVFVPLTVGGGIRAYETTDQNGHTTKYSAVEVADAYFRAGADKVSIGSDAVNAALEFYSGADGVFDNSISQISSKYGKQAVVISIDPVRVYVEDQTQTSHATREDFSCSDTQKRFYWYQCTIHGGRTKVDLDVIQLVKACQRFGAGELLVNSINRDGKGTGYDLDLIGWIKQETTLPVIASSGAGREGHFADAARMGVEGCLAAGVFHRKELTVLDVKEHLMNEGIGCRPASGL